ncbi:hypothetical protein, partial [Pelomonas sp. KK5]|uniref:hypothetical protein n=1 Tax=Pelomonas sp. KK5 TaxID=1855730 RepID=UPI001180136B
MTFLESLSALSSVATAVGVAVAAQQLFITREQATTSFEDTLTSQYRTLIERIPVEALFGEPLPPDSQVELLPHFYRYFDLCNEQAFLRQKKRITDKTWENWEDGIKSNMKRPAFAAAWQEVAYRAQGDFEHLRELCPPNPVPAQQLPNPQLQPTPNGAAERNR